MSPTLHPGYALKSRPAFRRRARARRYRRDLGRGVQVTIPALCEGRGQIELVEHAGDDGSEEVFRPLPDAGWVFHLGALARLEHPHAEDGAGRAGHADDEPPHSVSSLPVAPAQKGTTGRWNMGPRFSRGRPEKMVV